MKTSRGEDSKPGLESLVARLYPNYRWAVPTSCSHIQNVESMPRLLGFRLSAAALKVERDLRRVSERVGWISTGPPLGCLPGRASRKYRLEFCAPEQQAAQGLHPRERKGFRVRSNGRSRRAVCLSKVAQATLRSLMLSAWESPAKRTGSESPKRIVPGAATQFRCVRSLTLPVLSRRPRGS